jgi:hypothetical protein
LSSFIRVPLPLTIILNRTSSSFFCQSRIKLIDLVLTFLLATPVSGRQFRLQRPCRLQPARPLPTVDLGRLFRRNRPADRLQRRNVRSRPQDLVRSDRAACRRLPRHRKNARHRHRAERARPCERHLQAGHVRPRCRPWSWLCKLSLHCNQNCQIQIYYFEQNLRKFLIQHFEVNPRNFKFVIKSGLTVKFQ